MGSSFSRRKAIRTSEEQLSPSTSLATMPDTQSLSGNRQQRNFLPWKGKPKAKGHWALHPPSSSQIMSDVIEISAANAVAASVRDDEEEIERRERDRLREAAAESIGISPLIREDGSSRITNSEDDFFDDDETQDDHPVSSIHDSVENSSGMRAEAELPSLLHRLQRSGRSAATRHNRSSSLSGIGTPTVDSSPLVNGMSLTPKSSLPPSLIQTTPPFPTTFAILQEPSSRVLPALKLYPSSTILSRGFTRLWRSRTLVVTTLPSPRSAGLLRSFSLSQDAPNLCFLHIFKSAGNDERELERMEVLDASACSLLEEEFAGKRFVVKLSGCNVGGGTKEALELQRDQSTWFLSFSGLKEAQNMIAILKEALSESKFVVSLLFLTKMLIIRSNLIDGTTERSVSLMVLSGRMTI